MGMECPRSVFLTAPISSHLRAGSLHPFYQHEATHTESSHHTPPCNSCAPGAPTGGSRLRPSDDRRNLPRARARVRAWIYASGGLARAPGLTQAATTKYSPKQRLKRAPKVHAGGAHALLRLRRRVGECAAEQSRSRRPVRRNDHAAPRGDLAAVRQPHRRWPTAVSRLDARRPHACADHLGKTLTLFEVKCDKRICWRCYVHAGTSMLRSAAVSTPRASHRAAALDRLHRCRSACLRS